MQIPINLTKRGVFNERIRKFYVGGPRYHLQVQYGIWFIYLTKGVIHMHNMTVSIAPRKELLVLKLLINLKESIAPNIVKSAKSDEKVTLAEIYILLSRLESRKLVSSYDVIHDIAGTKLKRRYYRPTDSGLNVFDQSYQVELGNHPSRAQERPQNFSTT
jgi:DNA-binding PadR family transcriptional regulator